MNLVAFYTLQHKKSAVTLFIIIGISIFLTEAIIMEVLLHLPYQITPLMETALDCFVLICILFPLLYLLGIKPIFRQIDEMNRMKESLAESEREWEDTFNTITDMITIHDQNLKVVRANRAAEKFISLTDSGSLPLRCGSSFHGNDGMACPGCTVLQTGRPCSAELYEPEQQAFFDVRGIPRFDHEGQVCGVIHVVMDITDRKNADIALQQSEARLADAQHIARMGNWVWDIPRNELWWSDETFRIFGLEQGGVEATFPVFIQAVHPDDREYVKRAIDDALVHRSSPQEIDYRILLPDGTVRYVHEIARSEFDVTGTPVQRTGTVQDITGRKLVEIELNQSRQKFELLINSIDGIVWEADAKTFRFSFVSPQAERILGYPAKRWIDDASFWVDNIHPDDREWAIDFCITATREGCDHTFDYRMQAADGKTVWIRDIVTVISEGGVPATLRGVMLDITQKKEMELLLKQSEQDWTETFNSITDAITIQDTESNIIRYNAAAKELLGLTPDNDTDTKCYSHFHGTEAAPQSCPACRALVTGKPESSELHEPNLGRHLEVRAIPKFDSSGTINGIIHVVRDISERKRAEQALAQAYATLEERGSFVESIVANIQSGIIVVGLDMKIRLANRYATKLCGIPTESLIGMALHDVSPELHETIAGGTNAAELPLHLGRGQFTIGFKRFDLETASNTLSGHIITFVDLTEIIKIRQEMQMKDRLATMGEVVARVSHEMRNPLFGITAAAQILQMELELSPQQSALMNSLLSEGRRMNNLVEELLDCSREMKLNQTRFALSENLNESVAVVQGFMDKKQIEVKIALSDDNIQLNADPARIKQVMLNLLKNAADATPPGGTIALTTLQDATMVSISVKDSGRGIPDEDMDKIFDLFYTTKKHGTGQGLYICRKIIEAHGGRLTVESDTSGACFTICLPREGMEG